MLKRKKEQTVNEFNQVVVGNSLTKEAWKRLKKNRMAVFGMVVVIIYAIISFSASLLPIYPYDESVIDHQHLRPSLTKTSGELMLEQQYKNLYFKAWRAGRLVLTPEEDEMIEALILKNETNKVWDYLYSKGEAQREAGTFEFNSSEQKTIDKYVDKINTEIQITINTLYYMKDGKKLNLNKVDYDTLLALYCGEVKMDREVVETALTKEITSQVTNTVKANLGEDATQDDINSAVALEMENMSRKDFESKACESIIGKLETSAKRTIEKKLKGQIAESSVEFPYKGIYDVNDHISANINASLKHMRRYFLGTDYLGRDLLSRIIYGGQVSIAIGLIGTITSVIIGILVGAVAGYKGGKLDYYLMRFVDIMYGLPYMLLVIICMAIFGREIFNLFFALAMVSWLTIARMVRGQIMSLKNQEYVEAARSMGASTSHIILRHMVPNSLSVIIVYSTIRIPAFIMQESFLSFLGLGVQAPYASWGSLIGDGVTSMTLYPWKLICPSIAMIIFLFAMNFFGDGLRDAFDPQSKNQL
ncbi:MAG: ABC transporter permease subunit [Spirochaetales bacterium]|nr:ABC transporter permease subunit [Spirochaetales bacterium]